MSKTSAAEQVIQLLVDHQLLYNIGNVIFPKQKRMELPMIILLLDQNQQTLS